MKTLILNSSDVKQLLSMEQAMRDAEIAYKSYSLGNVVQPPVQSMACPEKNGETDVKSSYSLDTNRLCVKIAPGYWDNPAKFNLPSIFASLMLFDGDTGFPLCIMEASLITGIRTGAAGGLMAKTLARPDSTVLGMIGAGNQARMQARAIKLVFPALKQIKVWSPVTAELGRYKADMESELQLKVETFSDPEPVCRNSDIIITVTPGTKPIVMDEWVDTGTHICAIGADAPGKQELDVNIFKRARVFADSRDQCIKLGETRNPIEAGVFSPDDIAAEFGEVLSEKIAGRLNPDEITISDATGMSVQDNATAACIFAAAKKMGIGKEFNLFE